MMKPRFDWHGAVIENASVVDLTYRNTQNVRRFFINACGPSFKFDRDFMTYLKDGRPKTMGEAASEWMSRRGRGLGS
jgi:Domain of unknown function (DUF6434)